MTVVELSNEMVRVNEKIQAHELEIKYLEEILVTTSGPQPTFVSDLEREMMQLRIARDRFSSLQKQVKELANDA